MISYFNFNLKYLEICAKNREIVSLEKDHILLHDIRNFNI